MLIEIFPDIDVELITDRLAQTATLTLINKRQRTTKSLGTRPLAEAFTMFHNLAKTKRLLAERRAQIEKGN